MSITRLLHWMQDEDRSVAYLARKSEIDAGRLIDVIAGSAPTDEEVAALATSTGISTAELRGHDPDCTPSGECLDPLRCYTVAEAAAIMHVSTDTVRAEMREGILEHVVIGAKAQRIPRWALERRLMGQKGGHDGQGVAGG